MVVVVVRVWVVWGVVVDWEFSVDVEAAFEVRQSLIETVCLHVVFNA